MLDHHQPHLIYGYARVSTPGQSLAHQCAELRAMGADVIVSEQSSGARERPQLEQVLDELQEGDRLYVVRLDRLSRSLTDLHRIASVCAERGVMLRYGDVIYDDTDPISKLAFHQLAAYAEHERALTVARVKERLTYVRNHGMQLGRKPKLRERDVMQIRRLASEGFGFKTISKLIQLPPRRGEEPGPISVSLVKRALSDGYTTLEAWEAANAKARAALSIRSAA